LEDEVAQGFLFFYFSIGYAHDGVVAQR
jgi:hypothetical protein